MPIKHPAWYLRNPSKGGELVGDLRTVRDIVEGHQKFLVDLRDRPTVIEGQRREIVDAVENQGWAFFWSEILQDRVAVVRDERVKVPAAVAELPIYTVNELVRIGMLGKGKRLSMKDLRMIHVTKKVLDGTVVR